MKVTKAISFFEDAFVLEGMAYKIISEYKIAVDYKFKTSTVKIKSKSIPTAGIVLLIVGCCMMLSLFQLRPGVDRILLGLPLFILGIPVAGFGVSKIVSELRENPFTGYDVKPIIIEDDDGNLRLSSESEDALAAVRSLVEKIETRLSSNHTNN
jgi:hypothetical protein